MSCDCCGQKNFFSGIASSGLTAMSLKWCSICLAMMAEPKWIVDELGHENLDGILIYNPDTDSYQDAEGNNIPIKLNDGREFQTRMAYVSFSSSN